MNILLLTALLAAQPGPATYEVRMLRIDPPRLAVRATLVEPDPEASAAAAALWKGLIADASPAR